MLNEEQLKIVLVLCLDQWQKMEKLCVESITCFLCKVLLGLAKDEVETAHSI
jgi:hypothetical protein